MRRLLPSTALLLLAFVSPFCLAVSAGTQAADLTKAVVVLEPPYNRVLTSDSVTLKCQGTDPFGDSSTQWLHNGTLISNQTSYFIKVASVEDSGEYRCRKGLSELSDPVQLEVHVGWLLLWTPRQVFQEGEPIWLKCHSWKNNPVRKVQYFQNGKSSAVPSTSSLLHWPQIPFSLVMVLLFAVDTGLYFAVQRDLRSSMRGWKNSKVSWKQGP
uniref:low affinity immunoglobulin gamma Fc region receptor III-like isoform X5 n=1 Tax=Halichoerus grypus TaxID=9711 RepID=UPI001659B780|nr:low affinity immunoglobulin gamma Fc region receptor III-like isoform X5 [Halichoerus grypus]